MGRLRSWGRWLPRVGVLVAVPCLLAALPAEEKPRPGVWHPFTFLSESVFGPVETVALFAAMAVAMLALGRAYVLARRVQAADAGSESMRSIAQAVRDGSDAYLKRQFTVVAVLLVLLTIGLTLLKWPFDADGDTAQRKVMAIGRGAAFFMGAIFSGTVGFCGMRLATLGNLRVAQASRRGFQEALTLGYQTGTVTGLMTTSFGLLGGCLIVLVMGEQAYETLLGYAFGGSLLALFMRVGGGIYTKAADVGADLVGKVEQNIPEDDPRNAATIADNVGDNVGDCAGMAADVFESYSVTMVAAMILGYAAGGPKMMLFPLLVMAAGTFGSLFSTAIVGRSGRTPSATEALRQIVRGFYFSAVLSTAGFFALNYGYLRFTESDVIAEALAKGMAGAPGDGEFRAWLGWHGITGNTAEEQRRAWLNSPEGLRSALAGERPLADDGPTLIELAEATVPLRPGADWRPPVACLIGVLLALALMKSTEYWTSTEYSPIKSLVEASRTGHATNIIQGIAIGYESAVWSVILIATAISGGIFIFHTTASPIFVAFGVALGGIGMLTLTVDMLSMDVFGPVSDNANGIGEMGFNRDTTNRHLRPDEPGYIPADELTEARKILTYLDATGNTTKAVTKGIAIGSAVIAALSLFASFIAVLVKGSEEAIHSLTTAEYHGSISGLSVATPEVFIGLLIGAAVPFLFSSMTIRAVGRAANLIVYECRRQFRDPAILAGTKKPDYGRVVDICTATAQKELIGPGLLALATPILVGLLLGPFALGGFLAGMMVSGQLLAVFMATAGGAWDNAKKAVEDEPVSKTGGKGSETHKASITGDTVGDPLKDTAGPAINPLIKVMNIISLLALPLVLKYNLADETLDHRYGYIGAGLAALAIAFAWWQSKREGKMPAE